MIGGKERHEDSSNSSVAVSTVNVPTTQAAEQAASNLPGVLPPVIAPAPVNPPTATVKTHSKNYYRKAKLKRRKALSKKTKAGTLSPADTGNRGTSAADNLLDSYVVLQMKSGQKIQGVLKEITADSYIIELPGMGPFPYSIEKVKSIAAVQ